MTHISVQPIKTSLFRRGMNLHAFLLDHIREQAGEGMVLAVTSKIVSIAEGAVVAKANVNKRDLVQREADRYLGEGGYGIELTIKHRILIPSAGIDESNSEGDDFILFPEDPYRSAAEIGRSLRESLGLRDFAVIITDSHTTPLRRGVTGIALAHWGLKATYSLVGEPDLFGRALKFTSVNVVDSLAAMAVFVMGEADDCQPLALIRGLVPQPPARSTVEFTSQTHPEEIAIPLEEDLYYPLLKT